MRSWFATSARRIRSSRRIPTRPEEGWVIVAIHAAIIATAAWVVAQSGWVDVPASLAAVAATGALAGFVLAKTGCPDVIAHLTASLLGMWVVSFQIVTSYPELGGGRRERFATLIERAQSWYRGTRAGDRQNDEILFVLVLGLSLWLVAYLSAWTLFRRQWPFVSLLLPAFLVLIVLGYSPELNTWPILAVLLLSGILTARYFAFRRQQVWSRFRIPVPRGLSRRFLGTGSVLAVIVLTLAWTLPVTTQTDAFDTVRDRAAGPASAIGDWWLDAVPNLAPTEGAPSTSYAAFGDAFELGGALTLGNEPAIALRGTNASQYLVGLRYDAYTGRGWESNVAATFDPVGPDGTTYSPQLTFRPQQDVALSASVTTGTSTVQGDVTLLRPKGRLLFTIDTYLRSDLATSVQLSWRQLDGVAFDLDSEGRTALPSDLRALASLLRSTTEYGDSDGQLGGSPLPIDAELASRIQAEQIQLAARFLATRWEVAANGTVTLIVTGQVPTYDDIEAVFARDPVPEGGSYLVAGLESGASPSELREAGTDYPRYVQDRYLALPELVTPRTRDLAASLAGEHSNPFDVAIAIEGEVRDRIAYDLDIDAPPEGQDVVDYVLFESQVGYCEYHSSAMAVLLRAAGIPARVAVGYHQVAFDPASQAYVYKESDAHAWVEAFFPGYGWIPFEPTPSEPVRDYEASADSERTPPAARPTPTPVPDQTPDVNATQPVETTPSPTPPPPAISPTEPSDSGGGGWRSWVPMAVVTLAAAAAAGFWILWSIPYRGLSPGGTMLRHVTQVGGWLGVRENPAMTPDEYAAEIGRKVPPAREPARYVADLYAAERYGGHVLSGADARSGQRALRLLRWSMFGTLVRRKKAPGGDPDE